jgi:hypothetical protein
VAASEDGAERPAARAVRGLILVVVGLVIVLNRDAAIELAVLAVGLYVVHKGVEELLRLIARPPEAAPAPAAAGVGSHRRRRRVALGIAAAVFAGLVAVGAISTFNTTSRASPSLDDCNGSARLCDQPLAEVVLPATHNAMSGADIPDYLFANQDHAIPQQLEDGVRGLLIDTHYGIPANGGAVKTDLGKFTSAERHEYVKELGQEAFDAALAIRDRLVTGGEGEHQIYLCHRFCELGAVPLDQALGQIRDFIVSHPDQVLVIINEDYVSPEDFVAAVKKSGLAEYVYEGGVGPTSPTLGEMISSGHRVVLMAEQKAGVARWYRDGYGDVLQETPYSFKQASEARQDLPAQPGIERQPALPAQPLDRHQPGAEAHQRRQGQRLQGATRPCPRVRDGARSGPEPDRGRLLRHGRPDQGGGEAERGQ